MRMFWENQSNYEKFLFGYFLILLLLAGIIIFIKKFRGRTEGKLIVKLIEKFFGRAEEKLIVKNEVISTCLYVYLLCSIAIGCLVLKFTNELFVSVALLVGAVFAVDLLLVREGRITKLGIAEVLYPDELANTIVHLDRTSLKTAEMQKYVNLAWWSNAYMKDEELEEDYSPEDYVNYCIAAIQNILNQYFESLMQAKLIKFYKVDDINNLEPILVSQNICYNANILTSLTQRTAVQATDSEWLIPVEGNTISLLIRFSSSDIDPTDIYTILEVSRVILN